MYKQTEDLNTFQQAVVSNGSWFTSVTADLCSFLYFLTSNRGNEDQDLFNVYLFTSHTTGSTTFQAEDILADLILKTVFGKKQPTNRQLAWIVLLITGLGVWRPKCHYHITYIYRFLPKFCCESTLQFAIFAQFYLIGLMSLLEVRFIPMSFNIFVLKKAWLLLR